MVVTARFVFDTGASLVILPWKLATGLGLRIDQTNIIQTTTASTVESAPMITIPKMSVLGEEVKDVNALVKDLPPEAGVDGLLGLSFIKHFQVRIDFNKGVLTLGKQ